MFCYGDDNAFVYNFKRKAYYYIDNMAFIT